MGFCYYRYMLFVGFWSLGLGRPLSAQGLVSCSENLEDNDESNADNGSQLCKVPEGRKKPITTTNNNNTNKSIKATYLRLLIKNMWKSNLCFTTIIDTS